MELDKTDQIIIDKISTHGRDWCAMKTGLKSRQISDRLGKLRRAVEDGELDIDYNKLMPAKMGNGGVEQTRRRLSHEIRKSQVH